MSSKSWIWSDRRRWRLPVVTPLRCICGGTIRHRSLTLARHTGLSETFLAESRRDRCCWILTIYSAAASRLIVTDSHIDQRTRDIRPAMDREYKRAWAEFLLRKGDDLTGILIFYYNEPHYFRRGRDRTAAQLHQSGGAGDQQRAPVYPDRRGAGPPYRAAIGAGRHQPRIDLDPASAGAVSSSCWIAPSKRPNPVPGRSGYAPKVETARRVWWRRAVLRRMHRTTSTLMKGRSPRPTRPGSPR